MQYYLTTACSEIALIYVEYVKPILTGWGGWYLLVGIGNVDRLNVTLRFKPRPTLWISPPPLR